MSTNNKVKKYKLDALISSIPQSQFKEKRRELLKLLDVSPSTLGIWRETTLGDPQDIPGEKVRIIAAFFGMEIEELYNRPFTLPSFKKKVKETVDRHRLVTHK
jgi:hypothetical protein